MRKIPIVLIIFIAAQMVLACSSVSRSMAPTSEQWTAEKTVNEKSGDMRCTLESSAKHFSSGAGINQVKILIKENSRVVITSDHDPFDIRVLAQIGLRVGDKAPVLKPTPYYNGHQLWYSSKQSALIVEQLKKGGTVRIQVALSPRHELLTGVFSLKGFDQALLTYRMCEVFRAEQN